MDPLLAALDQPVDADPRRYDVEVGHLVAQVVATVGVEMRRQPASMVYELITAHLARRLPGIAVDHEALRLAAARIAVGLPVHEP